MRELTDKQLVAIVHATGSSKAYGELVRRYENSLFAFLRRLAGDDVGIDDLRQIAFLKGFQKISQFRADASFKTWLFKIAYMEFLQSLRHRKAQFKMQETITHQAQDPVHADIGLSIDLRRGLKTLSIEERAALLLCDAVGLSHQEACKAMNVPLGSLKTYVQRGRKKMKAFLEEETL